MSLVSPDLHSVSQSTPYFDTYPPKKTSRSPRITRPRPPSPDVDPPIASTSTSTSTSTSIYTSIEPSTPALRHSGSSSATQYLDTPPRTPPPVINFSLVSAPIPDVGTMDALVDGMNAFDRDDIFYASSLHRHQQSTGTKQPYSQDSILSPLASSTASSLRSRIPRPRPKTFAIHLDNHPRHTNPSSQLALEPPEPSPTSPTSPPTTPSKTTIPSIHDIVRAHANTLASSTAAASFASRDSLDLISRSSIDTIAEEVQHTLRQPLPEGRYSNSSKTAISDDVKLPQADPESSSIPSDTNSSLPQSEAIATYIRSARLTTLIKLPRPLRPPLQVSLSDLGDPSGRPLLVFLGLGAVRYLMGLYDEMAEIFGIRIITIDRWGLGRTTEELPNLMGVKEWAKIVKDVLDRMGIEQCSILAHSAGAPYAMSFANFCPDRVRGDICLLAPWVGGGENAGYKWLKYIPNSILKTAHAAEWRLQTWMLGKPPNMRYQGVGYNKWTPVNQSGTPREASHFDTQSNPRYRDISKSGSVNSDRSSIMSNDYDDLADFEGRFESRSTLTTIPSSPLAPSGCSSETGVRKRRSSRGFFHALLPRNASARREDDCSLSNTCNVTTKPPKLKNLRSIGSLKGSSKSVVTPSCTDRINVPTLPPIGLGLGGLEWPKLEPSTTASLPTLDSRYSSHPRSRRSVSLTTQSSTCQSSQRQLQSKSHSHVTSPVKTERTDGMVGYQAALANALIAASHAEASKGVHSDLLQILNHEGRAWGFSYTTFPHRLRVWYGDRDERIAEGAVRWMERTMGSEQCEVKVIKNADHGLMYRSAVIMEVFENVRTFWT